jgi:hypothetical protein
MSVIIIGTGGGGHQAITRLVTVYHAANAEQKAQIVDLIETFTANANALADEVDQNP